MGRFQQPMTIARMAENPTLRQRLGLTNAQVQQIESAAFNWQKERITARAQEQIDQLQLRQLQREAKPDESALDLQLEAASGVRLAIAKEALHYRLAMKAVLTPAQLAQLRTLRQRARMRPMHGSMHGPMARRPRPPLRLQPGAGGNRP